MSFDDVFVRSVAEVEVALPCHFSPPFEPVTAADAMSTTSYLNLEKEEEENINSFRHL